MVQLPHWYHHPRIVPMVPKCQDTESLLATSSSLFFSGTAKPKAAVAMRWLQEALVPCDEVFSGQQ